MTETEAQALPASEAETRETAENAAWASIHTPLSPDALLAFCQQDIERLFRINPYIEFKCWEQLGNHHFHYAGINTSQQTPFEFDVELKITTDDNKINIEYQGGIKLISLLEIETSPYGSKLTIREHYKPLSDDQKALLNQVDRSLTTWLGDIQKFIMMWHKWHRLPPWRWYMKKIWQPMKPSGRRICYMFWWITVVEIALIMLGAGIYFAEYA